MEYQAQCLPGLGPLAETCHVLRDGEKEVFVLKGAYESVCLTIIPSVHHLLNNKKANASARYETLQRRNKWFNLVLSIVQNKKFQ